MAVFAEGALSVDQVAIATKAPAYLDDHFADVAPLATVAQLRTMMRAARPAPPKPVPEHEETFKAHFDDDGRYRFQGVLDADHGGIVDATLTEARDALFQDGHIGVSWADAVVEMAQRSSTPPHRCAGTASGYLFLDPTNPVPASLTDGLPIPDWLRANLCVTAPSAPRSRPTAGRSASGARSGTSPSAPVGWCCTGTRSAGCRAAPRPVGCRSTTSRTAPTVVRTTRPTSSPSVPPTTGCTTRAASASRATPTTRTA